MSRPLRVLLVEDSPTDVKLVLRALAQAGWEVHHQRVEDEPSMRAALARDQWDVVLSDWSLPSFGGDRALATLKQLGLDVPFIIVSGTVGEATAVEAMRSGARDYVLKDNLARLAPALERELREAAARREARHAEEVLRRTEDQLRQAQKMEAIGGLAGGIAHDFNNLLAVVLGASELLLEDLPREDPLYESLDDIRVAGVRAAELTRQLLAFSRQQVLQPRNVDLDDVVTGIEKMLRRLIGEDVELATAGGANLHKVFVDSSQIEMVIMNLAVNARDAMPDGGKLTIETANVTLDGGFASLHVGVTAGEYVMLAVTDTGSGMDKATQARIFEPFFTTKEKGRGTGLGLATVFGIVQQSGGTIWVYSELGKGTTFKVYFPRSGRAISDEQAGAVPPANGVRGTETILLAEDDEAVRKVTRTALRRHGYSVLEAQNGGEALLLCEQHGGAIHLLLTDVVMPRMSGRALAERLRQIRPELRVLFMSGYTDHSIVSHGFLEEGVLFLQKPATPAQILRKVREALETPAVPAKGLLDQT